MITCPSPSPFLLKLSRWPCARSVPLARIRQPPEQVNWGGHWAVGMAMGRLVLAQIGLAVKAARVPFRRDQLVLNGLTWLIAWACRSPSSRAQFFAHWCDPGVHSTFAVHYIFYKKSRGRWGGKFCKYIRSGGGLDMLWNYIARMAKLGHWLLDIYSLRPTKSVVLACNEIYLIKVISSTKKTLHKKTHRANQIFSRY